EAGAARSSHMDATDSSSGTLTIRVSWPMRSTRLPTARAVASSRAPHVRRPSALPTPRRSTGASPSTVSSGARRDRWRVFAGFTPISFGESASSLYTFRVAERPAARNRWAAPVTAAAGLLAVTDAFVERTVVVVGDLITDEYLVGKPGRISREAPVIILRFPERDLRLGGAENAAHTVAALGRRAVPVGMIGGEPPGDAPPALSRRAGIATDGIVVEAGRTTPMKTRIVAGGYPATRQQVVRLDREPASEPTPASEDALLARLTRLAANADAILVSDYGYGTVSPRVLEHVKAIGRQHGVVVTVDSRYELPRFVGVTGATPNEAELADLSGHAVDDERSVEKAGRQLLERLDAEMLLITRGSQGLA